VASTKPPRQQLAVLEAKAKVFAAAAAVEETAGKGRRWEGVGEGVGQTSRQLPDNFCTCFLCLFKGAIIAQK